MASKIFKDEDALTWDYIPPRMPHRERDIERLQELLSSDKETIITIYGPEGIGKSDMTLHTMERMEGIRYAYANLGSYWTASMLIRKIASDYEIEWKRNLENTTDALMKIIKESPERHVFTIDNVEAVYEHWGAPGAFDHILWMWRELDKLSLIFICDCMMIPKRIWEITKKAIELQPYSRNQLEDIINYRAELAFHPNVVSDEILDLIIDIAEKLGGRMDVAIYVMRVAGLEAMKMGSEKISMDHLKEAFYEWIRLSLLVKYCKYDLKTMVRLILAMTNQESMPIKSKDLIDSFVKEISEDKILPPREIERKRREASMLISMLVREGILKRPTRKSIAINDIPFMVESLKRFVKPK